MLTVHIPKLHNSWWWVDRLETCRQV